MRDWQTVLGLWLVAALPVLTGCGQSTTAQSAGFAAGAFPPTLSDTTYHQQSWTREDCLVCHETGQQDAPVVKHVSVPELAMEAKCRTCHVLVPGSPAGRVASAETTHDCLPLSVACHLTPSHDVR